MPGQAGVGSDKTKPAANCRHPAVCLERRLRCVGVSLEVVTRLSGPVSGSAVTRVQLSLGQGVDSRTLMYSLPASRLAAML